TSLVAASALYSADHLQKLAAPSITWLTRGPATVRAVQAALGRVDPPTLAPRTAGSRDHAVPSTHGGVAERWRLIASAHRQAQAQRTVDKPWRQPRDQAVTGFTK